VQTKRSNSDIARRFLMYVVQHWGQTDAERVAATREYLEAAGRIGDTYWLSQTVLLNLRRGKFEDEVAQLEAHLKGN